MRPDAEPSLLADLAWLTALFVAVLLMARDCGCVSATADTGRDVVARRHGAAASPLADTREAP